MNRHCSFAYFVCLLAILLVDIAASSAQDFSPARLEKLRQRFPQADLDNDGVLTKAEAMQAMRRFRKSQGKQAKPDIAPPPTHANLKYGRFDRNVLDLWLPDATHPTALVVYIHGGGFIGGDKKGIRTSENVQKILDRDVAVAAINYRFRYLPGTDTSDPQRAGIQDILRDAARSIQFLRHHADQYNLDPERVACFGGSAGAGTSIWLAFHDDLADPDNKDPVLRQSSRISAAGMVAGQYTYDLAQWDAAFADRDGDLIATHGGDEQLIYLFYGMTESEYQQSDVSQDVDMAGLISADDPPVFAITANPDDNITNAGIYYHHPRHALLIESKCRAEGVTCVCLVPKVRPADQAALKNDPDMMLKFLFKHLDVPTQ